MASDYDLDSLFRVDDNQNRESDGTCYREV